MIPDDHYEIEYTNLALDGSRYYIPKYASHRPAVRALINGQLHEPETHKFVETFCSKYGGSVIHAGTFFGDMLPNFSKFVQGNVYAFEPVLENYVLAKLSVERNQLLNVVLINSALSEKVGNLQIETKQENGLHAGGASKVAASGQICSSLTIDCLGVSDIVLIQLDVEGHELMALKGAEQTINKCRPVIAIEDNSRNCTEFLELHGYSFVRQIPGLRILVPKENLEKKEFILGILRSR